MSGGWNSMHYARRIRTADGIQMSKRWAFKVSVHRQRTEWADVAVSSARVSSASDNTSVISVRSRFCFNNAALFYRVAAPNNSRIAAHEMKRERNACALMGFALIESRRHEQHLCDE